MTSTMVVMLIWVGFMGHGGPAVIPGFESMPACFQAAGRIDEFYSGLRLDVKTRCTEIKR